MPDVTGSMADPESRVAESTELHAMWLGRRAFEDVLAQQIAAREALIAEQGLPTLFLVEHPATITLGRGSERDEILWPATVLNERQVHVCDTPRGGQATLHAPGQLVAYPVVRIGRQIRRHVTCIGEVTVALLTELGVGGARFRIDHPGVWVGDAKIASIGLHVSRGIAIQGVSINLDVDPSLFEALISCGLRGSEMTSAVRAGAKSAVVEQAARRWAELYADATGMALRWAGA
jgi:lipoate-protein ligase B